MRATHPPSQTMRSYNEHRSTGFIAFGTMMMLNEAFRHGEGSVVPHHRNYYS